jgi:uncharacterized protein (TIGR03083 family)
VLTFQHYLDELSHQARLLRESARRSSLQAPVPSCPGWTVSRLVGHVTKVHRWTSWLVAGRARDQFEFDVPEDGQLFQAYDAGLADVLGRLRAAPDSLAVWTITPARSAKLFWARRVAHETAIHRVDANLAAGYGVEAFEPDFAADGIEELFTGSAARFDRSGLTANKTISVTPLDSNASWTLSIGPDLLSCRPVALDDADLTIFGSASDLYRWVWNRAADDDVALRGELSLADRWQRDFTVRSRPGSGRG